MLLTLSTENDTIPGSLQFRFGLRRPERLSIGAGRAGEHCARAEGGDEFDAFVFQRRYPQNNCRSWPEPVRIAAKIGRRG